MAQDKYPHMSADPSMALDASEVVPNDDSDLPFASAKGLYVGSAGDVSVVTECGSNVTFSGVVAGTVLPVRAVRVKQSGTTAGAIVALF
jgi:hypothetical protein